MKCNEIAIGMKVKFKSKSCGYKMDSRIFVNSGFFSDYKKFGYAIVDYISIGEGANNSYITLYAAHIKEAFDFLLIDIEPYYESPTMKTLFSL